MVPARETLAKYVPVISVLLGALLGGCQAPGRIGDAAKLTLDRIITAGEFEAESYGTVRWSKDGAAYTRVEGATAPGGGQEIVRYDCATAHGCSQPSIGSFVGSTYHLPPHPVHAGPLPTY